MKTIKRLSVLSLVSILFLSGCQRNISRNGDGTADVETTVTQQELQKAINEGIADPLIQELTVSLKSGYMLVSGTRQRLKDPNKSDTLSFRLDLGVSNNQLTATISKAQFDGFTVEQNRLNLWNSTIANKIAKLAQKSPNSTLKTVSVSPNAVIMVWNVTK